MGSEPTTVREACRRRMPLDGADAQALEGALQITERERDALRAALRECVEALERSSEHHHAAWQMLSAICEADNTRDRASARDRAWDAYCRASDGAAKARALLGESK